VLEFMERLRNMVHLYVLLLLNIGSSRASDVTAAAVHNDLVHLRFRVVFVLRLLYHASFVSTGRFSRIRGSLVDSGPLALSSFPSSRRIAAFGFGF
jgi:hypothetical protein